MSRLLDDPFSALARQPAGRISLGGDLSSFLKPRVSAAPPLDPAEEEDKLSYLAETGLGGLAYLGKLADKTFGGRAIRGLLGGHPRELASILPLSDSLGLTDERDVVTGRELLRQTGLVSAGQPGSFDEGDLAGLGVELALDPSTYFGLGPLTKGGLIAKKAGGLFKTGGLPAKLGGFAAKESDLAATAAARSGMDLPSVARQMGIDYSRVMPREVEAANLAATPRKTITDLLTGLPHEVAETSKSPIRAALEYDPLLDMPVPQQPGVNITYNPFRQTHEGATPLAGVLGVGLPFGEKTPLLTGGPVAERLARVPGYVGAPLRAADRAVESVTGFSPGRAGAALFDPDVQGSTSAAGQSLMREFYSPLATRSKAESMGQYARLIQQIEPLTAGRSAEEAQAILQHAIQAAEQATPDPTLQARLFGLGFTPQDLAAATQAGQSAGQSMRDIRPGQLAVGINLPELQDPSVNYALRSKQILPAQPGESMFAYQRRLASMPASHASQIARENIFRDIPGGQGQVNTWARDAQLRREAQATPLVAQAKILNDLAGGRPTTPEMYAQARRLVSWVAELPEAHSASGAAFYSEDLPANLHKAFVRDTSARTAAAAAYEALGRHATPGSSASPGMTSVREFLDRMGLDAQDAMGNRTADLIASQRTGIPVNDLPHAGIPADLARDVLRVNEKWRNPAAIAPALSAWDAISQLFKTSVTSPFPAFHVRNLLTGLFDAWRGGEGAAGAVGVRPMSEAYSFTRGRGISAPLPGMAATTAAEATKELERELLTHDVAYGIRNTQGTDLTGQAGEQVLRQPRLPRETGRTLAEDLGRTVASAVPTSIAEAKPWNIAGVGNSTDVFAPVAAGRKIGDQAENFNRVNHYLGLRMQGYSPAAAAEQVKMYQRDYSALTDFEKNVMRRVFPWYSFSRRNLVPLANDLTSDPGKLVSSLRVTQSGRTPFEFVPNYIAEGASVPIGGAPDGEQRYVSSFGLPFEDETVKGIGALLKGDFTRAGQTALGSTQPYIKSPLEYIFGTQLYSGRKLQDLRPSESVSLGGLVPEELARPATQVIANTPAARLMSSVDRIVDERKGSVPTAVNLLTGARISDVDAGAQQAVARKKLLTDLLMGQPGVRKSDDVYISKKAIAEGRVSDAELQLYRMYLDTDRLIKDQAKRR
jgi:hypothetical protein